MVGRPCTGNKAFGHQRLTHSAAAEKSLSRHARLVNAAHAYTRLTARKRFAHHYSRPPPHHDKRFRLAFHTPPCVRTSPPQAVYEKRHPKVSFVVVGLNRLELSTSRLSGVCSNQLSYNPLFPLRGLVWWRCTDSNRGPIACKSSALPNELPPQREC